MRVEARYLQFEIPALDEVIIKDLRLAEYPVKSVKFTASLNKVTLHLDELMNEVFKRAVFQDHDSIMINTFQLEQTESYSIDAGESDFYYFTSDPSFRVSNTTANVSNLVVLLNVGSEKCDI